MSLLDRVAVRRCLLIASVTLSTGVLATAAAAARPVPRPARLIAAGARVPCLYSAGHISLLNRFGALVGRRFTCAAVYNDAAPTWSDWEQPWFARATYSDISWARWATAPGTHRQLVITQNLFPQSEDHASWLRAGARGAFVGHARTLARNLVRAGLGHSVIRLAHEANGNWYPDSIPDTPSGDALWIRFWRRTAIAMRSVPGAHFQFDWTVNAGYRDVALRSFYPGNDVVNIIGVDAYDSAVRRGENRWRTIFGRADGIAAVAAFARAHGKPMSIPEWGLGPAQEPGTGQGGDDPAYVNGIAAVVAHADVAYQAYFDAGEQGMQFFNSPRSIAAFRVHFGAGGNAVGSAFRGPQALPGALGPQVQIETGPAYASTVAGSTAAFTFIVPRAYTAQCSLDGQPWRPCSGPGQDALSGLSAGYHFWNVQATNGDDEVSTAGRAFVVS